MYGRTRPFAVVVEELEATDKRVLGVEGLIRVGIKISSRVTEDHTVSPAVDTQAAHTAPTHRRKHRHTNIHARTH